jgi:hypothetical protein
MCMRGTLSARPAPERAGSLDPMLAGAGIGMTTDETPACARGAPDGRFNRAGARIERGGPIGSAFKSLHSRLNDVVDEFAVHRRVSVLPPEPWGQHIEWRSREVSPLHSSARNYCIIAQQRQKLLHHRMHKGAAPIVSEQSRPELASASKWQASTAKISLSWNSFEPFMTRGPWWHTLSASRPALRSVDVPSHVSQHTTFALHPQPRRRSTLAIWIALPPFQLPTCPNKRCLKLWKIQLGESCHSLSP